MSVNAIHDMLRVSLEEQAPIAVYASMHRFEGTVTSLDDNAVEIKSDHGRTAIFLRGVDAVTLKPHAETAPRRWREDVSLRPRPD